MLEIGRRIRLIRTKKNINLKDISSTTGITISKLIKIENGKTNFQLSTLNKILKALGVNFKEFYSFDIGN